MLRAGYVRAAPSAADDQAALRTALSLYNTGDAARGFRNGYVERVSRAAAEVVPALKAPTSPLPDAPPTRAWDVFVRPAAQTLQVF